MSDRNYKNFIILIFSISNLYSYLNISIDFASVNVDK